MRDFGFPSLVIGFVLGGGALLSLGATRAAAQQSGNAARTPAKIAPLPAQPKAPDDNPTTSRKVALGRQLFFDPRLSGDNTMSCATCHLPDKGLGDGLAKGKGHGGKTLARNTPTLLNVAFQPRLFWDGRAKTLEEQALGPIESPEEMHQDLAEMERELAAIPGYVTQFRDVFGTRPTKEAVARSLAAFERTLVTRPSPFDRYLAGDKDALSPSAENGYRLFIGDAGCIRCHHGPLLSDGEFYRLGVSSDDAGLAAVTGKSDDRGKLRTPTLRNVALTGPYMHDGSLKTLDDVVTFYYRGVPETSPDGLRLDVKPLVSQSFSEIPDLVAFLESLTGEAPKVTPPELP